MATKIVTKNSSTASAVPTASDLVQGELAVNVADKRLFTEDNGGAIVELGTNPSTIDINAGSIDGTAIGASSASTGAFTTLTASGAFTSVGIDDNATSTAITIDSSENVGIGTSSPDANLVVYETATSGTDHFAQRWRTQSGGVLSIACSDLSLANPTWQIRSGSSEPIAFNQASNERMRIDSSGNVGIGTSSPEYNLDVTADDNVTTTTALSVQNAARNYGLGLGAYTLTNRNIGGTATTVDYTFDIGRHAIFKTSNAERMRIDSSGRLLVGQTSVSSGGSSAGNATMYVNGGIVRKQASFSNFNEAWASGHGTIFEARSGFSPSNKPNSEGWFHVKTIYTQTSGSNFYLTQTCTTLVGRIYTRYNNSNGSSSAWSSWVEK